MPIYDSPSTTAKSLKGLHLYHFVFSNCSQRVRLALAEKKLSWVSHHLDLTKNEHINLEYQALNPKGVVPTLINDGEVVVESNDILFYLEDKFPEVSLTPKSPADQSVMEAHIQLSGKSQNSFKAHTFDQLFRKMGTMSKEDLRFLEGHRENAEVVQFMEDFQENGDVWRLRVDAASQEIVDVLSRLNDALIHRPWLSGHQYGLADISWVVNIYRLTLTGYDLEPYASLLEWFDRVSSRKAFADAVTQYNPLENQ
tara:strand:- start:4407 stop:5171 length:765 start_codon:yes stop_codon:yes gene_type:complete